jgi:hypothetical protein
MSRFNVYRLKGEDRIFAKNFRAWSRPSLYRSDFHFARITPPLCPNTRLRPRPRLPSANSRSSQPASFRSLLSTIPVVLKQAESVTFSNSTSAHAALKRYIRSKATSAMTGLPNHISHFNNKSRAAHSHDILPRRASDAVL